MENSIEIIHNEVTPYFKRIKYHIYIFLFAISFGGIILFLQKASDFGLFLLITSLFLGIITIYRILQSRFYLIDFISDNKNVKIIYHKGFSIIEQELNFENVSVKLKNTTSRAGFNCELIIKISNLRFIVNKDFDWNFNEMKLLFEFVKFHNNETLTEKEKSMISSITNYLEKYPF